MDEEDVDLVRGLQRPRERAQDEELECGADDEAERAVRRLPDAEEHEELHDQQVGAEMRVDPDAVGHLVAPVRGEEDDAREEAAGGEAAAREGRQAEGLPLVRVKVGGDVEDESKVGQMFALADCFANSAVGSTANDCID